MFNHVSLKRLSRLVSIIMSVSGCGLLVCSWFIIHKSHRLHDAWEIYRNEKSEKARLESSFRAAIGYGGMIHSYKNYVLRHDPAYYKAVKTNLGAAQGALIQYQALVNSESETVFLKDIISVLQKYSDAVDKIKLYIDQNMPIQEIDKRVFIDDSPALRGLAALKHEIHTGNPGITRLLSKGRLAANIRASLGYGGFIHSFKNYIIRRSDGYRIAAEKNIVHVKNTIREYIDRNPTKAEKIALDDISATFDEYHTKLQAAVAFVERGDTPKQIDAKVKVDDSLAIRGLNILGREIARQEIGRVDMIEVLFAEIHRVGNFLILGMFLTISAVITVVLFIINTLVTKPLRVLANSMVKIADGGLETKISFLEWQNEIGNMARTVEVFKENSVKRLEAEAGIAEKNIELKSQLAYVNKLHKETGEQAKKAMALAENLSDARKSAEEAVKSAKINENKVNAIINTVPDAVITINSKGIVETFNPGAENMFLYKTIEVVGKNVSLLMPEPHKTAHNSYLENFYAGNSKSIIGHPREEIAARKGGETFPIELVINTMKSGIETKITGVIRDITDRVAAQKEIRRMALTDPLTSLANRNQFNTNLDLAINTAKRFNRKFAVLLLDLDKFKPVNDTYGHQTGDLLLKHVSSVLSENFRDVDTVARIGGDEFSVICTEIAMRVDIAKSAKRVIKKLSQPISIDGNTIKIGVSIGISLYPSDSEIKEDLIKKADKALYVCKEDSQFSYCFYEDCPGG